MRAQCCICADLFEGTQTVNISATPCGHVFHEACLMRWMDTSSTCPSCRTHIKKTQVEIIVAIDLHNDSEFSQIIKLFSSWSMIIIMFFFFSFLTSDFFSMDCEITPNIDSNKKNTSISTVD